MIRALVAGVVLFALGLVFGYLRPGAPEPVVQAVRRAPPARAVAVQRPNAGTAVAVGYLNDILVDPKPPTPPPAPKPVAPPPPPPPPPPPDVAVLFRQDVTAVKPGPGGPEVWLRPDPLTGKPLRRLTTGATYRDGWRVAALTASGAVLRKGREERQVSFYGG